MLLLLWLRADGVSLGRAADPRPANGMWLWSADTQIHYMRSSGDLVKALFKGWAENIGFAVWEEPRSGRLWWQLKNRGRIPDTLDLAWSYKMKTFSICYSMNWNDLYSFALLCSNSYILVFLSMTRQEEGGSTGRAWNEHETSTPAIRCHHETSPILCSRRNLSCVDGSSSSGTNSTSAAPALPRHQCIAMHLLAISRNSSQCHATASHSSHLSCLPPQCASCSSPVLTGRLLPAWKCNVGQGEKRLEFVSNARHGLACSPMQGTLSF